MNPRARGTFEVTLEPQPLSNSGQAANLNRLSIAKQYHGDLEATSHGEMLANSDRTEESGVYVALERVSGQLHGRSGTFVLYHNGLMVRGESRLVISVVPDSGTGELAGLAGTMTIDIVDGAHFFEFDYTLEDTADSTAQAAR